MKIHYSSFEIINIKEDKSIDDLWFKTLKQISLSSDKLKNNYKEIDLSKFISFYVAVDQNKILGFSGLQYMPDRWGRSIARCMSRFYLDPEIRHGSSLFKRPLLTEELLPRQISDAKKFGIKRLFMSRESGKKSLLKSIEYLKSKNLLLDFRLLPNMYNVCGNITPIPYSCRQYIAVMDLDSTGEQVWNTHMLRHRII